MSGKIANTLGRDLKKTRTPDKITAERRSAVMSSIKSKGTKLEQAFMRQLSNSTNLSFETNVIEIKGKPDIVFYDSRVCVFIDSDFWHGWQLPRWEHLLKNEFWITKIENNRRRDRKTTRQLRYQGWSVIRVWEHNIKKNIDKEICRILEKL